MELRQELCPSPTDVSLETVPTWALWLTEVERRIMPHCTRREARHRGWASLRGLLSPIERTNGWQVAEAVGDTTPYGTSISWGVPGGIPRRPARPYAPLSSHIWAILRRCWW